MKIIPKVGFCVIYHPFEENAQNAPTIFQDSLKSLKSVGDIKLIIANELIKDIKSAISVGIQFKKENVDVICMKLATWSSDDYILEMSSIYDVPFIFWTYPHINAGSMCGGQQFNMVFKELKKDCIFVYKDDALALQKIKNYAICVSLRNQLKTQKLLKIGNRTQGMAEVICDEFSVKEILGPRILSIGFEQLYTSRNEIKDDETIELWRNIKQKVGKISVNESEGLIAIKNYLALKKIIDNEQISGITLECYPHHMGELCLAFSLLANEGIASACEGDVNSLILAYILMKLSGSPFHNIDPLYFYEDNNTLIGSHCGCGSFDLSSLGNQIELANVRLANKGLCVLFPSKPGKVTMANLVGRKGTYRLSIIEAEALQTEMIFPGNPIKLKLSMSINAFLDKVEKFGIGHHWIIVYGDYVNELKILSSLLNIDLIEFP